MGASDQRVERLYGFDGEHFDTAMCIDLLTRTAGFTPDT
jgi:hypothetical protein